MTLKFTFCNESLPSIITGLDPQKEDVILVIGGSGDQALALLEFGCKVYVIDRNSSQVNYIKNVVENIRVKNFDFLFNIENKDPTSIFIENRTGINLFKERNLYFNNLARINTIASNINNLVIIEPAQSIFDFLKHNYSSSNQIKFTKIYLSNIFTTMSNYKMDGSKGDYDFEDFTNSLNLIGLNLLKGGLVYFADGDLIRKRLKLSKFNSLFAKKFTFRDTALKVNTVRTKEARKVQLLEDRVPLVLEKIT